MKRLVLFVEGEGDERAMPALARRVLGEIAPWDYLTLDERPFKVGGVGGLLKNDGEKWVRLLRAAVTTRRNLGAVLLVLDGDAGRIGDVPFCTRDAARDLAERARGVGAGAGISVACVLACMEYESWLLSDFESLRGKPLPDGRPGVSANAEVPGPDTATAPRDAKGWLVSAIKAGYKPTTDQLPLTMMIDLAVVHSRSRSFRRFENALKELCEAVRTGNHIATPGPAGS